MLLQGVTPRHLSACLTSQQGAHYDMVTRSLPVQMALNQIINLAAQVDTCYDFITTLPWLPLPVCNLTDFQWLVVLSEHKGTCGWSVVAFLLVFLAFLICTSSHCADANFNSSSIWLRVLAYLLVKNVNKYASELE